MGSGHSRQVGACLALAAHALGYWIAPFVHAVGHRPDHVHTPAGPVPLELVHRTEGERPHSHHHEAGDHEPHRRTHRHHGAGAGSDAPQAPDHGSGSFDHFSGVLGAPAAALWVPRPAWLVESAPQSLLASPAAVRHWSSPSPRGPPRT